MVNISIWVRQAAAVGCIAVSLAACTGGVSGSVSNGAATPSPQYTVGGMVSGLSGSGLMLATNTGETLTVAQSGSFTFKTSFPVGSPYYVLVLTQPSTPTQTCLASNGSGTIGNANVTSVTVACQDKTVQTDAIGGVVVGLTGSGLVLQNNGADNLKVSANGAFAFPTALPTGSAYNISVLTPPVDPYEDCEVLNGQGTTADTDIASIGIICTVNSSATHTVGGTISGVSGALVLEDNGRDDLTITADGAFKFPLAIPSGSSYNVTTKSATGGQSQACTFTNATGTIVDTDVTNVTITCQANVSLAASVSGLAGTGLILQNTDDGDNLAVTTNGTVPFAVGLMQGSAYNVTVVGQPTNPSQTCVVTNGSGTATAGTIVAVACTTDTFTVGGTINGLPDPNSTATLNLVLKDSVGDTVTIAPTSQSPMTFTFATPIASGLPYSISVQSQPGIDTTFGQAPGVTQTSTVCVVSQDTATGMVTTGNITNVVVNCVRPSGFVYVTNSADNTISPYIVDVDTGNLLLSGPPVATGTAPSSVTTTGTGILYVSNSGSNNVSAYTIDPNTGALTPLSGSPFALAGVTAPSSVSTSGSALYVTYPGPVSQNGAVAVETIAADGSLTALTGSPFSTLLGPTSGQFYNGGFYPTNYTFFVELDAQSATVSDYVINGSTGALVLASNAPFATGTGPTALTVFVDQIIDGNNDDAVYVTNSVDGTISVFSVDNQSGNLSSPQAAMPAEKGLQGITSSGFVSLNPCGCFVFASGPSGVWGFDAASTGVLTAMTNNPYPAGAGPGPITTDGFYVYVVNTTDQTISVYVIATGGSAGTTLTPVSVPTAPPAKTGRTPSSIVMAPRPTYGG